MCVDGFIRFNTSHKFTQINSINEWNQYYQCIFQYWMALYALFKDLERIEVHCRKQYAEAGWILFVLSPKIMGNGIGSIIYKSSFANSTPWKYITIALPYCARWKESNQKEASSETTLP